MEPTIQNLIAGASWIGSGDKKLSTSNKVVTFDANGGEPSSTVLVADKNGKIPAFPDAPKNGDREFVGWFTEKDGGDKIKDTVVFSSDTIVFAHWSSGCTIPEKVVIYTVITVAILKHLFKWF